MIVRLDPLEDIFSQAETTEIAIINAPVEKPLDLGALARIHTKGKVPPSTFKIDSLEFMFLQDKKWYRYDAGLGKILPLSADELKKYSNPLQYMLIGPVDQNEESKKSGVRDFALYELANKGHYR